MTRVLHTGDTHVGYQQYHDPRRRRDFLDGFEAVIEDAIEEDVDAVVHAGDLFHDRRPDLQDLQGVVAALRDLRAADVPFLAIVGNHEAKRSGQWLDLFADLDLAERLGDGPRVVGDEGSDLALYGLDHVPESQREDLDYEFDGHDAERSALVAHGLFGPFDPAEWDTEGLLEAATVDFDAMLLGDNHDPGTQQVGDVWVTYPGSTERASASERADRGYNIVTVEDGDLRITRRTLETREFVFVDLELDADEGAEVVRERVREYDHEDAVTIVTIEGDGEPIAPGPIEELATEQGAVVARVNDRREHAEADRELDVSFADPDEAVRDRVREMGLSPAARDLDRVIRDDAVADSNVRESARRRVEDHREDGLGAFEPAPESETGSTDTGESSDEQADEPDSDRSGEAVGEDATDEAVTEDGSDDESSEAATDDAATEDESSETAAADADPDGTDDEVAADAAESSEPDSAGDDAGSAASRDRDDEPASTDGDGQVSMEDFL